MAMPSNKKNFDFRMSKKVAELTQVVHMLFTRNHEKEVEMESLKESYEHEIGLVIMDARNKIQVLHERIHELEQEKLINDERLEATLKEECMKREAMLQGRIQELETQLAEEKTETQSSRDLLIQAQKDLHNIRQVHIDETAKKNKELDVKTREVVTLNGRVSSLEQELRDKKSLLDSKGELLRTHEKLRKELEQFRASLQAAEKTKEELVNKNRHFESEIKNLKRELAKKSHERNTSAKTPVPVANGYTDYNEELERLKKELKRYKMEISNRESNFNRMFTEKQPVHVNDREPRRSSTRGRPAGTGLDTGGMNALRTSRDRHYSSEMFTEEDVREIPSTPRSGQSALSRSLSLRSSQSENNEQLPQLQRMHSLVKPRLPKELITAKR